MPYISRTTAKITGEISVTESNNGVKYANVPVELKSTVSKEDTILRCIAIFSGKEVDFLERYMMDKNEDDRYVAITGTVHLKESKSGSKYNAIQVVAVDFPNSQGIHVSRNAFKIVNDELKPNVNDGKVTLHLRLEDESKVYKEPAGYTISTTLFDKQAEFVIKYLKDKDVKRILLSGIWHKRKHEDKSYHTILAKDVEFVGFSKWDGDGNAVAYSSQSSNTSSAPVKQQEPKSEPVNDPFDDDFNFDNDLKDIENMLEEMDPGA